MKQLNEDRNPTKLHVRFSEQINQKINLIWKHNQNNRDSLSQWCDYIEGIKSWLSNPSIAWDYANRFTKFPNGSMYIRNFNYNIGYTVKTNQYGAYVYVFMINLRPQEFGLKTIKENKLKYSNNIMNTNKKIVRLTESELHNVISESVRQIISELDWKTYENAKNKALERGQMEYWRDRGETMPKIVTKAAKSRQRANNFEDAATRAFNRDYGYKKGKYGDEDFKFAGLPGNHCGRFDSVVRGYDAKRKNCINGLDPLYGSERKRKYFNYSEGGHDRAVSPEEFFDGDIEAADAFIKANDEFENYRRGKSKYIKGKGWQ